MLAAVEAASGRGKAGYSGPAPVVAVVAVVVAAAEDNSGSPHTLAALAMAFVPEVDNLAPEPGVGPEVEDGLGPVLVPAAVGALPEQDMELHRKARRCRASEWNSDTSLEESTRAPGPGAYEHTTKAHYTRKRRPA